MEYEHPIPDLSTPKRAGIAVGVGLQLRVGILRIEPNVILPLLFASEPANRIMFLMRIGGQVGVMIADLVQPFIDAHARFGLEPTGGGVGFEFSGGADFALGEVLRLGLALGYKPTGNVNRLLIRLRFYFLL